MQKLLVFIFLNYCVTTVNAQFSVNTTVQRHSNVFFQDANKPFNSYANWGIGGSYQSKGFHVHTSITGTTFHESLHSSSNWVQEGSFGSIIASYFTEHSVDVEIKYIGCRVGMDYVLHHQGRLNLLIGMSVQNDWLVVKREFNNTYKTNYPFNFGSPNQEAVSALEQFVYWNLLVKPRYYFLPHFYAELQLGFSFYYNPRTNNKVLSSSGGESEKNYYTESSFGLLSKYVANEIGLSIGYRFKDK